MELATLWAELGIPADYATFRNLNLQVEAGAGELVSVAPDGNLPPILLTMPAAAAWASMRHAAAGAGITLIPVSGFRSVARQGEIIREKLARGLNQPDILRLVAAPGYSEHHTGRAIDITAPDDPPLEEGFAQTSAFKWLQTHARDFGFTLSFPPGNPHGIAYEPWHWLWQPSMSPRNPTAPTTCGRAGSVILPDGAPC